MSKIVVSSDYILSKIRHQELKSDTYIDVVVKIGVTTFGFPVPVILQCYNTGNGEYQISSDSFIGLIRLLKTIADQPITLLFASGRITIKEMIV